MHEYHYIRYHFVRRSDCTYIIYHGPLRSRQRELLLHRVAFIRKMAKGKFFGYVQLQIWCLS